MTRQTQHRPTRDARVVNKELATVKRENQALKRKVAKLQKFLQKALENKGPPEEEEAISVDPQPKTVEVPPSGCPNCGEPGITHINTPVGVLMACRCGWRKKK